MLAVPAWKEIEGVTIYPDDAVWFRFYTIAQSPQVRRDANGRPVFLLAKYAFSDEARASDPKLPTGGGYLNVDVELVLSASQLAAVRSDLQQWINAEWQRLRSGTPEERGRPGVASSSAPPQLELATPTFTQGKIALDAPQAEALTGHRVTQGMPSLLAGNIAVFSMDLTAEGASFMQRVLVGEGSDPGSDLTPLQVAYDLKFWARLPAVRIHVKANSKKLHSYLSKVMEGGRLRYLTPFDLAHGKIDWSGAQLSGLIDIQIDTGSGSLSDEIIAQLRQYALQILQEMVENNLFKEGEADKPPQDEEDPPSGSSPAMPGRRPWFPRVRYLRQASEISTATLELLLEQRSVVEWEVHPQATLETFFRGYDRRALKAFVRTIDLDDDFFKHLGLSVRVFTDFHDDALSAVEVQVRYEGQDESGVNRSLSETFTFTSNDPQTWNPSLIGRQRQYFYRYRVAFKDRGFSAYTDWAPSSSPDLNVAIPAPGRVKMEVLGGDIDFANLIERVQVPIAYEDASAGIQRDESTAMLTAASPEGRYERLIYDLRRQPILYKRRFTFKTGRVLEDDAWQSSWDRQIVVNQPFVDFLQVSLLPVGDGWEEVIQVHVLLRYIDADHDYRVEEGLILKSSSEFRTWKVLLRDPALRDFEYRVIASFKDGRFTEGDWQKGSGSSTLPIEIKAPPRLRVTVLAQNLDYTTSPVTEVTLRYRGGGPQKQATFTFTNDSRAPQVWTVGDVPAEEPVDFTYQVTYNPAGRERVIMPEVHEHDTVVVVPSYRPPRDLLSVQILPLLLDLGATPIVVVDLRYDDEAAGLHQLGSITLTDKKPTSWDILLKDPGRRAFSYRVTYYSSDGTEHPTDWVSQDAPRIIIPKSY